MMSLLARDLPRCGSAPSAATSAPVARSGSKGLVPPRGGEDEPMAVEAGHEETRSPAMPAAERSEASHALPASKRSPAYEADYALPRAPRAALANILGPAAWTANLHGGLVGGNFRAARVHALDPGGCRKANRIVSSRPARPPICRPMTHPRCSACEFSFTIIIEEPPDKGVGICANHGCLKYGERQAFVSVPGPPAGAEAI